jgi:hypothetical protein
MKGKLEESVRLALIEEGKTIKERLAHLEKESAHIEDITKNAFPLTYIFL